MVLDYIKSLLRPDSKDSIKSFAMLMSTLLGVFLGVCLGISIIIDVYKDGVLDSDLYGVAACTVAIGGMVTLSSIPKYITDKEKITNRRRKNSSQEEEVG